MKSFNFNEIENFDNHINLSIPNYDFLKNHIKFFIEAIQEDDTNVLDLGCSTGSLLIELDKKENINYYGYDISNLIPNIKSDNLKFIKEDLDKIDFPDNASVITSIFTLQFLPSNKRKNVLKKIYNSLNKGAYFIMCEKIYLEDKNLENLNNIIYYKYKRKNFSDTEILKKQEELANVMKLKTLKEIEEELSNFSNIECFWKSYGFCGIIAKK